jgi:hypothetical protein
VSASEPFDADAQTQSVRPVKTHRPDGLQTGSPSSPSPRLIRPSVRLLLRSPRFWVRVPSYLRRLAWKRRRHFGDLLKLDK